MENYEIARIEKEDGSVYEGGVLNEIPHFFGVLTDSQGNIYQGDWKKGDIDGTCFIRYVDSRQYLGTFRKGIKEGIGAVLHKGKVYLGEYFEGKRTGYGEVYQLDPKFHHVQTLSLDQFNFAKVRNVQNSKRGYFNKGKLDGYGELSTDENKYCYFGMFKDGNLEGVGVETTNSDQYSGVFSNGLRQGIGTSESILKGIVDRYEGYWLKNTVDGFSKHLFDTNSTFLGFYKKGRKSGAGRLTIDKKYDFTGYFYKDLKSKFGKEIDSGDVYIGNFDHDLKHGYGYSKKAGKYTYIGDWVEGKMQGVGYQVTDLDEYKGEFFCDQRHGRGVLKINNQAAKSLTYKNGVVGKEISENLEMIMEQFTKSKIDKFFEFFQEEIQLVEESLASERKNFKAEFAKIQQDFTQENKSLDGTISSQRREIKIIVTEFLKHETRHKKLQKEQDIKVKNQLNTSVIAENKNWRYFESQSHIIQNVTQSRLDISPDLSFNDKTRGSGNQIGRSQLSQIDRGLRYSPSYSGSILSGLDVSKQDKERADINLSTQTLSEFRPVSSSPTPLNKTLDANKRSRNPTKQATIGPEQRQNSSRSRNDNSQANNSLRTEDQKRKTAHLVEKRSPPRSPNSYQSKLADNPNDQLQSYQSPDFGQSPLATTTPNPSIQRLEPTTETMKSQGSLNHKANCQNSQKTRLSPSLNKTQEYQNSQQYETSKFETKDFTKKKNLTKTTDAQGDKIHVFLESGSKIQSKITSHATSPGYQSEKQGGDVGNQIEDYSTFTPKYNRHSLVDHHLVQIYKREDDTDKVHPRIKEKNLSQFPNSLEESYFGLSANNTARELKKLDAANDLLELEMMQDTILMSSKGRKETDDIKNLQNQEQLHIMHKPALVPSNNQTLNNQQKIQGGYIGTNSILQKHDLKINLESLNLANFQKSKHTNGTSLELSAKNNARNSKVQDSGNDAESSPKKLIDSKNDGLASSVRLVSQNNRFYQELKTTERLEGMPNSNSRELQECHSNYTSHKKVHTQSKPERTTEYHDNSYPPEATIALKNDQLHQIVLQDQRFSIQNLEGFTQVYSSVNNQNIVSYQGSPEKTDCILNQQGQTELKKQNLAEESTATQREIFQANSQIIPLYEIHQYNRGDYESVLGVGSFLFLAGKDGILKVSCSLNQPKTNVLGRIAGKVDSLEIGEIAYCEQLNSIVACSLYGNTLFCFDFQLNLLEQHSYSPIADRKISSRTTSCKNSQKCKKNLQIYNDIAIWSFQSVIFFVKLDTQEKMQIQSFLEIEDTEISAESMICDLHSQCIFALIKSKGTGALYMHYASEASGQVVRQQIVDVNIRYASFSKIQIVQKLKKKFSNGLEYMLVAGSSFSGTGVEKATVMVCRFDVSMIPVSSIVIQDLDSITFDRIQQFRSNQRSLLVLTAEGWIFLFEMQGTYLVEICRKKTMNKTRVKDICIVGEFIILKFGVSETQKKYGDDESDAHSKIPTLELFSLQSIPITKSPEKGKLSMQIQFARGYSSRQTGEYSSRLLSKRSHTRDEFTKKGIFPKINAVLDQSRKQECQIPLLIPDRIFEQFQSQVVYTYSWDSEDNYKFRNLKERISGFDYKLMQNYFDFLKEEEIKKLELFDFSKEGRKIKIFGRDLSIGDFGGNLVDLSNLKENERGPFSEFPSYIEYCSFDKNFNLCYILNSRGQLAVINLDLDLVKKIPEFEPQIKLLQISSIISNKNCSRILATSNKSNWDSNQKIDGGCVFKLYKEEKVGKSPKQLLQFDLPHLFDTTSGSTTDFSQEVVFVIGRKNRFATLAAMDFLGDELLFQNDFMKPDDQFKHIERFPGTNILVLQSTFNLTILKYFESTFYPVKMIEFNSDVIDSCYVNFFDIFVHLKDSEDVFKVAYSGSSVAINSGLSLPLDCESVQNQTEPCYGYDEMSLIQKENCVKRKDDAAFIGEPLVSVYSREQFAKMVKSGHRLGPNSGVSSRKSTIQKKQRRLSPSMSKKKPLKKTNQKLHSSSNVAQETIYPQNKRKLEIQIDFGSLQEAQKSPQKLIQPHKQPEKGMSESYQSRPQLQESSFIIQPSTNVGQLTSNKKYKYMDKMIKSTFDDTVKIDEEFEGPSNNPSEFSSSGHDDRQNSQKRRAFKYRSSKTANVDSWLEVRHAEPSKINRDAQSLKNGITNSIDSKDEYNYEKESLRSNTADLDLDQDDDYILNLQLRLKDRDDMEDPNEEEQLFYDMINIPN